MNMLGVICLMAWSFYFGYHHGIQKGEYNMIVESQLKFKQCLIDERKIIGANE